MRDLTPDETTYPDEWFVEQAKQQHGCDGEVEIDDGATVSRSSDGGAYVAAWVWVYVPDSEEDDDNA